ncbi:hypothetical protein [Roseomonas sp. CECT 9278]|uniref:hypothetical protein n=1 Tax=Roseomonas sp. CECT 9278 TaxID=2845823 RepID=UPI001E605A36|nr:hypothetical protein [Roseomonas sp. CECT 9278]CAH0262065.1 hypothetical protein ROS9278_03424 [Roseomonas sp. CECT 9278]
MLELVAMVCAAVLVVWTPIEARKVAGGWVRKRHKGTPAEFRAAYRKQLALFFWMGIVLGLGNLGLAFAFDDEPARGTVKLVAGALWLGVSVSAFISRRIVDAGADAAAR